MAKKMLEKVHFCVEEGVLVRGYDQAECVFTCLGCCCVCYMMHMHLLPQMNPICFHLSFSASVLTTCVCVCSSLIISKKGVCRADANKWWTMMEVRSLTKGWLHPEGALAWFSTSRIIQAQVVKVNALVMNHGKTIIAAIYRGWCRGSFCTDMWVMIWFLHRSYM